MTTAISAVMPALASEAAPGLQIAQNNQMSFDIPAQPLTDALIAFGAKTEIQIAAETDLVGGLDSQGVSGTQSIDQAMDALLAGTGIGWRYTGDKSILLYQLAEQDSTSSLVVLPPVTVTGERVTRSLRETSSSVTVVGRDELEHRVDIPGTNEITENMSNVVTLERTNFGPIIRGIDGTGAAQGAVAFMAGVRPRLTQQIDGRPAAFNELLFANTSLWDAERVELFRGPQSTVQGRNSIAGAIIVETNDPTYEPETKMRGLVGNQDRRQVAGMVSGPLVENQLAGRIAFDWSEKRSEIKFQPYAGESDPEEYYSKNFRAKLLFEPRRFEAFSSKLTFNYIDHKGPQGESVLRPFGNDGVAASINVATFNPRSISGVWDTTYDFSDSLTLENMVSYTDIKVGRNSVAGTGNVDIDGYEGVIEPRLLFNAFDHRLNGFAAFYALKADQDEFIDIFGGNAYVDETETIALFGEATYSITDSVDLTAGARVEQENRQRTGGSGNFVVDFDETYQVFLPKLGAAWHVNDAWTVGATVARGYNAGGAGVTFAAPFQAYSYDEEYSWNYEAFARADLLGGRLQLTGNVFYAEYEDYQLPFNLAANSIVIGNADEVVTYGTEVGATWLATPDLELTGSFGVLQSEIKSFPNSGFEGNELLHAPEFTTAFGVVYRPFGGWELGANTRFSTAQFSDAGNTDSLEVDPIWVTDFRAAYNYENLKVFGYVRNAFDAEEQIDIVAGRFGPATDSAVMLQSREIGVGMEVKF